MPWTMRSAVLAVRSGAFAAVAAGILLLLATPAPAQTYEIDRKRRECDRILDALQQTSRTATLLEGEGLALTARNEGFREQLVKVGAMSGDALEYQQQTASFALARYQSALEIARRTGDPLQTSFLEESIVRLEAWIALLRERHVLWEADLPFDPQYNVTARRIVQNELRLGEIVRELTAAREAIALNFNALPRCKEELAVLETLESGEVTEIETATLDSPVDGVYDSYGGVLTFRTIGGQTTGDYRNQGVQVLITGHLNGDVLEGTWTGRARETEVPCPSAMDGYSNWGKVRFVFNASGFTGASGFCEAAPSIRWDGVRRAAAQ